MAVQPTDYEKGLRIVSGSSFVLPSPLPEEILNGWRGRVAALNVLPKTSEVGPLLNGIASQHLQNESGSLSFLDNAASALSTSPRELARWHTLIPFLDVMIGIDAAIQRSSTTQGNRYRQGFLFRTHGKRAVFCPQCVAKDLETLGFSYWHRSHQLPGAIQCPTHGSPLFGSTTVNAFEQCPHLLTETRLLHPPEHFDEQASEIIDRYNKLANEILSRAPRIDSVETSSILGKRSRANRFRLSPRGTRRLLSTHILQTLPLQWLCDAMPGIQWENSNFKVGIDGVSSPRSTRYSTAALCLVAAFLYQSADEAIQDLFDNDIPERRKSGKQLYISGNYSTDKQIYPASMQSQLGDRSPGKGCFPISSLLDEEAENTRDALSIFLEGMPLQQACIDAKVSQESIEHLLRLGWQRLGKNAESPVNQMI